MIQHYMYCAHRWGLIEIEKAWAENYFVVKGNIMHERVHSENSGYTFRGKKVCTSVSVWNDEPEYNLFGVTDCIEQRLDNTELCIVEYKPTKPKNAPYHEEDAIQLFAQKICVDYVFGGNCKAVIYYGDVKKRIEVDFVNRFEEYNSILLKIIGEIRTDIANGIIPPIKKGQNCSGCSMKDLCIPKRRKEKSVKEMLSCSLEDDL